MFRPLHRRPGHYALIAAAWAALCLVNLGGPALWDVDEGNNAEAAREMYASGNWIVPAFNFALRVDKPVLLYWLQATAYHYFGVSEFSARLPSALAALLALLLTYELGRKMFGAAQGLLAALVLASTVLFCAAGHFANPDALLNAFTLLTFYLFWRDYERGGDGWLAWGGISTGLGMLTKGPVGLVLPAASLGLFLLWAGRLRRAFRPKLAVGALLFILVAVPWYVWVGAETKFEFLRGFFYKHNFGRFLAPMENHRGTPLYYAAILLAGFAPWSAFFVAAGWHFFTRCPLPFARRQERPPTDDGQQTADKYRFLGCWVAVYLVFFTASRTKLPNYVLPLYPPLALLVADFLVRWRRGEVAPPAWVLHGSLAALCLTGVLTAAGLLVGGGAFGKALLRGYDVPGLAIWAGLGALPVLAGLVGWRCWARGRRARLVAVAALAAVAFTSLAAAWAGTPVDRCKAVRPLAAALHANGNEGEVFVGTYQYFQPSLVFYCRREVTEMPVEQSALDFLQYPVRVYLFVPARVWEALRPKVTGPCRELARHRDVYRGCDIVLVTNR